MFRGGKKKSGLIGGVLLGKRLSPVRCPPKIYAEGKKRQQSDNKGLPLFHYVASVYVESLEFSNYLANKKEVKPNWQNPLRL